MTDGFLPARPEHRLAYKRGFIKNNKYVKFDVNIILTSDRTLLLSYQETKNKVREKNCIEYDYLYSDDNIIYGIRVYTAKYMFPIFEKLESYTISFSSKFTCEVNILRGMKNYLTIQEAMDKLERQQKEK